MPEKIARLGIERDIDLLYFIKSGDVWGARRRRPGDRPQAAFLVAAAGIEMDYDRFLYYLDGDGDIARQERASFGERSRPRKKKKKTKSKRKTKTKTKKQQKKKQRKQSARKASLKGRDERARRALPGALERDV
jgi:hypothetical protein